MGEGNSGRYAIIHGHFYQPPRENPWTERIDRQESAAPYHDWNSRICSECYGPNSRSRLLDGYGRVTGLVNNYEHLSFNFGPTLASWLERQRPRVYERILEADRASAERRGGHGNAIAQVYNHIIMPLAEPEDQKTQIVWGVHDFRKRFGRDPEGIWLAETAINETVLEALIDHGFRFIILSPHQAERYRPLSGGSQWKSAADGSIPAGMPYRCFGARKKGRRSRSRSIDIFFYDTVLSTDISFNHLLRNGDELAHRIAGAFDRGGGDLVTIATDGEIYGHHEPFGDMAMAYLAARAASASGLTLTNFGEYLDSHEPAFEVQIKQGRDGEGTAWSCPHGVGRWKEDCGCSTGAPEGWNQKWRAPLRKGLDALREELFGQFVSEAGSLLKDPVQARNEYISVIEDRSVESAARFIEEHSSRTLGAEESSRACALLESQRHALLMFTSCGWFFNDISGIETVQLLEYAARAIELAGRRGETHEEKDLLKLLDQARSNIPSQGSGKDIYMRARGISSVTPALLAAQHLISSRLDCPGASPAGFGYAFEESGEASFDFSEASVAAGSITVVSPYDLSRNAFEYAVVTGSPPLRITCHIRGAGKEGLEAADSFFAALPKQTGRAELLRAVEESFAGELYSIRDLFAEDRESILTVLSERRIRESGTVFEELYMASRDILRLFGEVPVDPPPSLMAPGRAVLNGRLDKAVGEWRRSFDESGLDRIRQVVAEAEYYAIPIDKGAAAQTMSSFFLEKLKALAGGLDAAATDNLYALAEFCAEMKIDMPYHEIQNEIYDLIDKALLPAARRLASAAEPSASDRDAVPSFLKLAARFNFNTDEWQEHLS